MKMTNLIKKINHYLEKKQRNHLLKKYQKLLDKRAKSTRKAYQLIGSP